MEDKKKQESNQNPEQKARDLIDQVLIAAGWAVQDKLRIDLGASQGVAVREYQTDVGPAYYVLFVDRKPVGIIESKREREGLHPTKVEDQSRGYAGSKLKHLNNDPLRFVYESSGIITRFTDYADPKPRSREVSRFYQLATFSQWLKKAGPLRAHLQNTLVLEENSLRSAQIKAIKNLESSFKANHPRVLTSSPSYTTRTA